MFTHVRCTTLLLSIGLILATDVFAAERIWDSDLKRYLTEQELSMAEVYLSEEEAVKLMLPKSERITKDLLRVPTDRKAAIEDRIGWKFPEDVFEVYIGETGTQVDGYALLQNTIGKHKPMTYMVGVDNRGRVSNIELLVFREARGSEVRRKRFNAQYEGKTVLDPIRINKDIINISGATMSVRSISAGIKRALVLVDEFYLKPAGFGSDTVASKKSEQGIFGSIFGN